ncbi:MAG TPA: galactokinase family protein [Armatimonadota bacterium]|nr:galactokinase family protein [Armatimonadota bacterium]
MAETVAVSAPGRLCLFGEHQDFLGLSVIACAVDVDIRIWGTPRTDTRFAIDMPDLGTRDEFDAAGKVSYRGRRDYIRSATNVVSRNGVRFHRGYDCTIRGTIPINAGTSSSSALTVAWIGFSYATQIGSLPADPEQIARLAHLAEVVEFAEPGGMMDHYTSALGGLLYIDCAEPITVDRLPAKLEGFVLGDSQTPKDTTGALATSRSSVEAAIRVLREHIPDLDIRTARLAEAEPYLPEMTEDSRRRLVANLHNRDICQQARRLLMHESPDPAEIGRLITEHHLQLRDGIGVSTPKLDRMIEACMEAGALGCKVNGSGGGGCMFAYAPGRQEQVKEAIDRAGGRGIIISVREGATLIEGAREEGT